MTAPDRPVGWRVWWCRSSAPPEYSDFVGEVEARAKFQQLRATFKDASVTLTPMWPPAAKARRADRHGLDDLPVQLSPRLAERKARRDARRGNRPPRRDSHKPRPNNWGPR